MCICLAYAFAAVLLMVQSGTQWGQCSRYLAHMHSLHMFEPCLKAESWEQFVEQDRARTREALAELAFAIQENERFLAKTAERACAEVQRQLCALECQGHFLCITDLCHVPTSEVDQAIRLWSPRTPAEEPWWFAM